MNLKYLVVILALAMMVLPQTAVLQAFGHGVHSGVSGSAVGAAGITDWHLTNIAVDAMLQVSLVTYCAILGMFGYFVHQSHNVWRIAK